MSLTRILVALAALAAVSASTAHAQAPEQGRERFFADIPEDDDDQKSTFLSGSIVSTSFYYRESAADGAPYNENDIGPPTASPFSRLFTDMRLQLNAGHISGGSWDFRGDIRARYSASATTLGDRPADSVFEDETVPTQSGLFSGNEAEVREFYLRRNGEQTDVLFGRQYSLELAATKFDGLQFRYRTNKRLTYLIFAGAYPQRGSRDIREDYPRAAPEALPADPADPTMVQPPGGRIVPAVGGLGLAYRFDRYYGAVGAVGILPLADDVDYLGGTGTLEKPRVFGTANGYWRQSQGLDIYHYLVADAESADGAGLRNLTLGVNYRPVPSLHTYLQVIRIDTETLNATAQTKLEDPDQNATPGVQNNIEVLRIAAESVRAGISASFARNRFEVSVAGTLRRRPPIELVPREVQLGADLAGMTIVLDEQQAADLMLRVVDRRMFERYRVGATATRTFPVGDANLARTEVVTFEADLATEIQNGRGEAEVSVGYVESDDPIRDQSCAALEDLLQCFGTSRAQTITLGGLAFYRLRPEWFVVGSLSLGYQLLESINGARLQESQPAILQAGVFARIAYRF